MNGTTVMVWLAILTHFQFITMVIYTSHLSNKQYQHGTSHYCQPFMWKPDDAGLVSLLWGLILGSLISLAIDDCRSSRNGCYRKITKRTNYLCYLGPRLWLLYFFRSSRPFIRWLTAQSTRMLATRRLPVIFTVSNHEWWSHQCKHFRDNYCRSYRQDLHSPKHKPIL